MKGGSEMAQSITYYEEPKAAKWLFASPSSAPIWLLVRIFIGYQWLHAGWEKVTGTSPGTWNILGFHVPAFGWGFTSDSWLRSTAGLKGFAAGALQNAGHPYSAVNYGWYASFLRWIEHGGGWMAPIIAVGEVAIGVGLILGILTGVSAFFGGILTTSFGLAGVAGVNPLLFVAEVFLVLAWRNAGYYGVDRYLLPALGTPWRPGKIFRKKTAATVAVPA
jgi:thiosulfate dehydrogenase [quinone] large subunit